VSLQVRSVDRLYLQAYVPKLMSAGLLIRFLLDRGFRTPSPALLGKIGAAYVRAIERFASGHQIPVVRFRRGESKEELARPYFEQAEREGRFGVVPIGVAAAAPTRIRISPSAGSRGCPTTTTCTSATRSGGARS
jgi:hypothetical protein